MFLGKNTIQIVDYQFYFDKFIFVQNIFGPSSIINYNIGNIAIPTVPNSEYIL